MTTVAALGRYRLLGRVSSNPDGVELWHAHDDTLDRSVAIRLVPLNHPRRAATIAAAQVAATVEDGRLLRVLDIIDVEATPDLPAAVGVVSEWVEGRTLEQTLTDRHGTPFAAPEALGLVADVARAIAAGAPYGIGHGHLRPSSIIISDIGETRLRGLGVDGALFGLEPLSSGEASPTTEAADVDALGALTYLLNTGYWPGAIACTAPSAPPATNGVLPPSQVRAAVPRSVDDLVARSLVADETGRQGDLLPDAASFAVAAGAALDYVAPVTTTTLKPVMVGPPSTGRRVLGALGRIVAVVAAIALVAGISWVGWQLLTAPTEVADDQVVDLTEILTTPATPVDELELTGVDQPIEIVAFRSYDPYGDDDGNGKTDKRKGRENEELAVTVNDVDPDTAWLTSQYDTADLDGKGGVGLILDLGEEREVQQVSANLVGSGTGLEVRVADAIQRDPALWTPLGTAFAPRDRIDIRAPRPLTGRYVLLWFTQLPPIEGTSDFQGGVRSVSVT